MTTVDWLSWLERSVHIREVVGSSPTSTTIKEPLEIGGSFIDSGH